MPATQTDQASGASRSRNGHPADGRGQHERILAIQRVRLVEAVAQVACEVGLRNLTVAHIVARAGVSRRTFYEVFHGSEDCILAACEEAVARATDCVVQAGSSGGLWQSRVRAGLLALLRFSDEHPDIARLLIVESTGAGIEVLARRQQINSRLVAIVDQARAESQSARGAPQLTAEATVGAVTSVLHARLLETPRRPLIELLNPLMGMIVLPYLGSVAARRELKRSAPAPVRTPIPEGEKEHPLKALKIRVTYRTARALRAVAANPGASNRRIGDASGIGDQGQVSKLLGRLEKLGLVENTGPGRALGGSNAWTLTARGKEVQDALATERQP